MPSFRIAITRAQPSVSHGRRKHWVVLQKKSGYVCRKKVMSCRVFGESIESFIVNFRDEDDMLIEND